VVKIEKGAVLATLGGGGEFASEEGLQDGGGGGVHRDFDRDRFAALGRPDAVAPGGMYWMSAGSGAPSVRALAKAAWRGAFLLLVARSMTSPRCQRVRSDKAGITEPSRSADTEVTEYRIGDGFRVKNE
jgi:hypothetical protein